MHLASVRRKLLAAREEHASAMVRYREKLKLEQLKSDLLREAGQCAEMSV